MRWNELHEQRCSIARALAVVGDRWTLLVLRDCFLGIRRFDAFQQRLGVTRHILADRLRKLEAAGVLTRVRYRERPPRYEYRLTDRGLDLYPVIVGLLAWGERHFSCPEGSPLELRHKPDGHPLKPQFTCSECGREIDPHEVEMKPVDMKPSSLVAA